MTTSERERGAGLVGAVAGVTVFLAFLTFALQLLVHLHTASLATAAAYDAARLVAGDESQPPDGAELAAAEAHARRVLGDAGATARFTWDLSDPGSVGLRLEVESPRFVAPVVGGALGSNVVDRTVTVRIEEVT